MYNRGAAWVVMAASLLAGCSEAATPTVPAEEPGLTLAGPALPLAQLLDSASFAGAIRTLFQSSALPRPLGRIAMAYAMADDTVTWIHPLWESPGSLADSLSALIRKLTRPPAVAAAREGITLSIAVDAAAVSAHASVRALPQFINRDQLSGAIQLLAVQVNILGSWEFLLRLDRTGHVVEVVTQKKPGSDIAAERMANLMTLCLFTPATVDGFAVPSWVSLPLAVVDGS